MLYSSIVITKACTTESFCLLIQALKSPNSLLQRYAGSHIIQPMEEPTAAWRDLIPHRLSNILPSVFKIHYACSAHHDVHLVHHSWSKRFPGLLLGCSTLTELTLSSCDFHSSVDLLRVMALPPGLKRVKCHSISWKYSPDKVLGRKCNRVNDIHMNDCTALWPILGFWTLPHASSNAEQSFPGIPSDEMRILLRIVQCAERNGSGHAKLHESWYPKTCQ